MREARCNYIYHDHENNNNIFRLVSYHGTNRRHLLKTHLFEACAIRALRVRQLIGSVGRYLLYNKVFRSYIRT